MAKDAYIGIGGSSHKVKNIYVGIGNISKKIKKGYIGVNGVSKLFYQMMKFTLTEVTTNLEFEYVSYPYEEDLQACTAFNKAGLFGLHPEENKSPYYGYSYINLFDDKMTKSLIEIHPASTSVQISPLCASDGNKMYFIMYYDGPYNVYQLTSSHTYSVLYPNCTNGSMMQTNGFRNRQMHDFFDGFFHLGSDVTDVFHMSSTGTVTTLNREDYTPDTDEAETPGSALLGDNMILACWDALMGNQSSFAGAVSRSLTYQNLPNLNNPRSLESGCASNGDAVVISGYVRYEEDLQEQYFDKALVLHTLPDAQWVPYRSTPLEFQGNACFVGGDSGYGQSRNAIISYDTSLTLHRVTSSKTIARYPAAAYAGDYIYSTKAVDWETDGYRQMNVFKLS